MRTRIVHGSNKPAHLTPHRVVRCPTPQGLDFLVAALDVVLNCSWRMASWFSIDLMSFSNMFEMNFFTNVLTQHQFNACVSGCCNPPDNMGGLVHSWFIPIKTAYDGFLYDQSSATG